MKDAWTFVHKDYLAERYRTLYGDPDFCVVPPIPNLLDRDPFLRPPADVEKKAGRPKNGPRKRARYQVNGEFHSSARHSQSTCSPTASAGAGAVGGAAGSGLSQDGLSQSAAVDMTL